jgi:hypothetical protein
MVMPALQVLADSEGSVCVGWVARRVLFAGFEGGLSATLGEAFAAHLGRLVLRTNGVRYFSDAHALTHYDLHARRSFVRTALAHRSRFQSFVFRTWPAGIGPASRVLSSVLGGSVEFLTSSARFYERLAAAAPLAPGVLDSTLRAVTGANGTRLTS